jgi:hypothetical protein
VTAIILLGITVPGHILFFFLIFTINSFDIKPDLSASLVIFYVFFASAQVVILLLCCYFLVHVVWRSKQNPDNVCIPVLTGLGDLLGTSFLFLCFQLVYLTGNTSIRTFISASSSSANQTNLTNFTANSFMANTTSLARLFQTKLVF